jgi:hypothetical protein
MTELERQRSMLQIGKAIYTAKTQTAGGRENGTARSSDGLDVDQLGLNGLGADLTCPRLLGTPLSSWRRQS